MDKIIIVHYINVSTVDSSDISEFMDDIVKRYTPKEDNILSYWIPINGETRIECINPKMITGEEYKKIQKFLDYQTEFINDILNKK